MDPTKEGGNKDDGKRLKLRPRGGGGRATAVPSARRDYIRRKKEANDKAKNFQDADADPETLDDSTRGTDPPVLDRSQVSETPNDLVLLSASDYILDDESSQVLSAIIGPDEEANEYTAEEARNMAGVTVTAFDTTSQLVTAELVVQNDDIENINNENNIQEAEIVSTPKSRRQRQIIALLIVVLVGVLGVSVGLGVNSQSNSSNENSNAAATTDEQDGVKIDLDGQIEPTQTTSPINNTEEEGDSASAPSTGLPSPAPSSNLTASRPYFDPTLTVQVDVGVHYARAAVTDLWTPTEQQRTDLDLALVRFVTRSIESSDIEAVDEVWLHTSNQSEGGSPFFGWRQLAVIYCSFLQTLPFTEDIVSVMEESANYTDYISNYVFPLGPPFSHITGLDLTVGATLLSQTEDFPAPSPVPSRGPSPRPMTMRPTRRPTMSPTVEPVPPTAAPVPAYVLNPFIAEYFESNRLVKSENVSLPSLTYNGDEFYNIAASNFSGTWKATLVVNAPDMFLDFEFAFFQSSTVVLKIGGQAQALDLTRRLLRRFAAGSYDVEVAYENGKQNDHVHFNSFIGIRRAVSISDAELVIKENELIGERTFLVYVKLVESLNFYNNVTLLIETIESESVDSVFLLLESHQSIHWRVEGINGAKISGVAYVSNFENAGSVSILSPGQYVPVLAISGDASELSMLTLNRTVAKLVEQEVASVLRIHSYTLESFLVDGNPSVSRSEGWGTEYYNGDTLVQPWNYTYPDPSHPHPSINYASSDFLDIPSSNFTGVWTETFFCGLDKIRFYFSAPDGTVTLKIDGQSQTTVNGMILYGESGCHTVEVTFRSNIDASVHFNSFFGVDRSISSSEAAGLIFDNELISVETYVIYITVGKSSATYNTVAVKLDEWPRNEPRSIFVLLESSESVRWTVDLAALESRGDAFTVSGIIVASSRPASSLLLYNGKQIPILYISDALELQSLLGDHAVNHTIESSETEAVTISESY